MFDKAKLHRLWKNLERTCRIVWFRLESDQCFLRASSLSFQSVLSVVPLLAVMFGIAKGFGLEQLLQAVLEDEFRDQQEIINYFIQFGYKLLEQTRGGLIAGVGIIVLLFTVVRLFSNIESTLNYMWGLKTGRTLARKASDYLALILFCPILIVASSSTTVFITTKLSQFAASGSLPEGVGPLMIYVIILVPYVMSTILFTLVYIIIPYTNVQLKSSIVAGLFAGIFYQILQGTYINIQIEVSNAGAIYGSFAALPLFLMWLYLSWVIFLIGAQVCVIHQERLWDPRLIAPYRNLTLFERELSYLSIVKATVDAYNEGATLSTKRLSLMLRMPERLVNELVGELINKKLLLTTQLIQKQETGLIPAVSPEHLRIFDVLYKVEGSNDLTSPLVLAFEKRLVKSQEEIAQSSANILIKDIHIES